MIVFGANPLDRASEKRSDAEWLARKRGEPQTRVLPIWRLQPLVRETGSAQIALGFLESAEAGRLGSAGACEIFLGLKGDAAFFARDISGQSDAPAVLAEQGAFREARAAASLLHEDEAAILGQARTLIDWHARHAFCAQCGAPSMLADAGYRRICTGCKAEHFPRTDPVVIMLVTAGERCLLARNRRFPGGHHSTLAGFIEPGETIEEAVRREVYEEVHIRIGAVRYFASQPWPFPSNLMIGCFAQAENEEIAVDGDEIVTARWFDRITILNILAGENTEVTVPKREAIAHHLIRNWAERKPAVAD